MLRARKAKSTFQPVAKAPVKKDELVVVMAGAHRGSRGKVLAVSRNRGRVLIEGVGMIKKSVRRSQQQPQGGFAQKEGWLNWSNVMSAERYDARRSKRGTAASAASKPKTAKAS